MLKFYVSVIATCITLVAFAQKKPLTLEDFNSWNSIQNRTISKDGKYVLWRTVPQEGNATLHVYNTQTKQTQTMPRASGAKLSPDGHTLLFRVKPDYEEERALKRKKTKKDKMPKDHLVIWDLTSGAADTIKNIESFKLPKEEGNWVAITFKEEPKPELTEEEKNAAEEEKEKTEEKEKPKKENKEEKESSAKEKKDKKKKPKKAKGDFVRLLNLASRQQIDVPFVKQFYWPEYAQELYYLRAEGDSIHPKGLFKLSLSDTITTLLDSAFKDLKSVSLNKRGTRAAYLTTTDSAKADIRFFAIKFWDGHKTRTLLDTAHKNMPNLMPAADFKPVIDENNKYILIGIQPVPTIYPKDTMALEEEKVKLDIWHWYDKDIQPYQNLNIAKDKKKAFVQRIDLIDTSFHRNANARFEIVRYNKDTVQRYAAAIEDWKYAQEASWLLPTHRDLYILDWTNGNRILVAKNQRTRLRFSPKQKYAIYWSREERHWFAFDIENEKTINLTENLKHPIWNEDWDTPDDPMPYSNVGWIGDSVFVFTDRYDVWGVNPAKPEKPVCYTQGKGRENKVIYGVKTLDQDAKYLPKTWLIQSFNEKTKDEGLYSLNWQTKELTTLQEPKPHMYGWYMLKAKNADKVLFTTETFNRYPELQLTNTNFENPEVISNTNPQQAEFNWGTVELTEWKGYNKKKLQGLVYKPENFDSTKKYPMLVYFYERYADLLHDYKTPAPSASTINVSYYVSNGYVVFIPDVVYKEGEPGQSAYDCIVSGTKHMMKNDWVDAENMAIQGQSWGGYQVAYLVTQTNLYKCAMAGAPVSNMTSAYGGIRWGSGLSREFQYEKTQSRLGKTMWEDRDLYIKNSPVFFADKVKTPLLMMHNDNDGAVPWYQGIEYYMALRRLGKPVWMLVYNGEAHNLRKRHNRKDLSIRMAQFFDHFLKGERVPEWMLHGRKAVEKETNPATKLVED